MARFVPTALVILVVAALLWFVFMNNGGGKSARVGDAKLNNIQTYLSKSGSDVDKMAQTTFQTGDPIQVGFTYTNADTDSLVRYVIKMKDGGEEVFTTNLFRLNPEEAELFVSINNTSLEAGDYVVELQDSDNTVVSSVAYSIQ